MLKSMLVFLCLAVISLSVAFVFIQTEYAKNIISSYIVQNFNDTFEGDITIGKLDGILPFQFTATDLELTYMEGGHKETLLRIDAVTLNPSLWDLLFYRVRVNNLVVENPFLYLSVSDGAYTIERAFKQRGQIHGSTDSVFRDSRNINIFAPAFKIISGRIHAEQLLDIPENVSLPMPFEAYGIDLNMRLEVTEENTYLDIDNFAMDVPGMTASPIQVSGQIYNDDNSLELNYLRLITRESSLTLNSLINGVNLAQPDIRGQLEKALYVTELHTSRVNTRELQDIFKHLPELDREILLRGQARGYVNDISLNDIRIDMGDSRLRLSGALAGLLDGGVNYSASVEHFSVTEDDLTAMMIDIPGITFKDWDQLVFQGEVFGDVDSVGIDMGVELPLGSLRAIAKTSLKAPYVYSGTIKADSINALSFPSHNLAASLINLDARIEGQGFDRETAIFDLELHLTDSYYDIYRIPMFNASVKYQNQILEPEFTYERDLTMINGLGRLDFSGNEPSLSLSGEAALLNLADFTDMENVASTSLSFLYDFNIIGAGIDQLYGRANLDIGTSIVNGDTLQPHQMYVDVDQPNQDKRTLRFTSNIMDMFIVGDIQPTKIFKTGLHWSDYFQDRITEEILLKPLPIHEPVTGFEGENLDLNLTLDIKDLSLLRSYFPNIPLLASNANLQFSLSAGGRSFLISGGWKDTQTRINGYSFTDPDVRLTAHFRHGNRLREFSSIDIDSRIRKASINQVSLDEVHLDLSMRQERVEASQRVGLGQNAYYKAESVSILDSLSITTLVKGMELGNPDYLWVNLGEPVFTYGANDKVGIENARFVNDEQIIDIQGVFSSSLEDSVTYTLANVDLNRISNMLNGRIDFQGMVDAEFFTKSLNLQPGFQGEIIVDRFAIDNRVIGDIDLVSNYEPTKRRFDTRLAITTDSLKYASYLENNNGIGQHIVLDGYFYTPNLDSPQDTLYYFDADFREIDLWIIPYIATGIFEEVEGRGDGKGLLTGNLDDYYFHADLYAHDAYLRPIFFNTHYNLSGHVELDRHKGVSLNSLEVRDQGRGRGKLYGQIGFNNFGPERDLNITLELNSLAILNNTYQAEAYFYGNVAGSGIVNVSGTNQSPYVRTVNPIRTTPRSRFSIPLLDETRVDEQGRSIRFVDDFTDIDRMRQSDSSPEVLRYLDRAFAEVFQLDLQFIAPENSIIQLVFDPITGEVLNAEGGGRIRVTLEDEELKIFGGFDINSGDYQFVGGDIFSRRFTLRDGGSIRWDGDPVNARLDITALYRARPNINALLVAESAGTDQVQRVPVDLLLDITGTIQNIENDFYFEFPNAVDATQNAAILSLLNSDEQKLMQATSLLFTGGFISVGSIGANQAQAFSSNMQNRTAQVGLGNLLSNQINTLLNSNLGNLDIDFNLSGFDQADLGIALRLFDDRLVLRRDGQVTGPQADIGDVGAKYQISNALSVEVFHRKDPALLTFVGSQGQLESVNGVGLEAQMQFNTWKQFTQRIRNAVTGLFGRKDEEDE